MDDDQVVGLHAVSVHQLLHRPARRVHITLRLSQHHVVVAPHALGRERAALGLPIARAHFFRHQIKRIEAGVVARVLIFLARISQADNQKHAFPSRIRILESHPKPSSSEKLPGPTGPERHRDVSRPCASCPNDKRSPPEPLAKPGGLSPYLDTPPCSRTPSRTTASARSRRPRPSRRARGQRDARTCDVKQTRRRSERRNDYSNRLATEPLLYTFLMVCANSGASVTTLILPVWRSSGTGTALVTTTSSMQEFSSRS